MIELQLSHDASEIVPYNLANLMIHAKTYWLSYYPNMSMVSHWHNDFEFIICLEGQMLYFVNGTELLLNKGQGIFVNAGMLHYGRTIKSQDDCQFLCMLFHPSLFNINSFLQDNFALSISQNQTFPFLLLSPNVDWQQSILTKLHIIYEVITLQNNGFELVVLSHFYALWHTLYLNLSYTNNRQPLVIDKRLSALQLMIGFLQKDYSKHITLNQIALAGSVCRSSCCDIFREFIHMTPMQYLTNLRIEKSIEYLMNTALSVTEIALLCGFNSSSYYTELFRREVGKTPTDYRKTHN